jgi:hypothetical protein
MKLELKRREEKLSEFEFEESSLTNLQIATSPTASPSAKVTNSELLVIQETPAED